VADQFVHLGVHAALSGAKRLGWLVDMHLSAQSIEDWESVVAAARSSRTELPLAMVLGRTKDWFGTGFPSELLIGSNRSWAVLCRMVDRLSPLPFDPGRPALSRAFARSARATRSRTLVEFGRHSVGFMRSGMPRERPDTRLDDPSNPASPLFDADDPAARARYLAVVGATTGN
jgi:hypothetical protein